MEHSVISHLRHTLTPDKGSQMDLNESPAMEASTSTPDPTQPPSQLTAGEIQYPTANAMAMQNQVPSSAKEVPQQHESDYLTALPPELLTEVVKLLPAREIYRLRRISKAFKASIDTNEASVARLTARSNQVRLATRLDSLVNILHLHPIEALGRWISYYGNTDKNVISGAALCRQGGAWIMLGPFLRIYYAKHTAHKSSIMCFFNRFLTSCCDDLRESVSRADLTQMVITETFGRMSPESLHGAYQHDRILFSTEGPHYTLRHGIPKRFLTERNVDYFGDPIPAIHPRIEDFIQTLGLPTIPKTDTKTGVKGELAYCVKSGGAFDLVRAACLGVDLSPLQRTYIMEDLFIW